MSYPLLSSSLLSLLLLYSSHFLSVYVLLSLLTLSFFLSSPQCPTQFVETQRTKQGILLLSGGGLEKGQGQGLAAGDQGQRVLSPSTEPLLLLPSEGPSPLTRVL